MITKSLPVQTNKTSNGYVNSFMISSSPAQLYGMLCYHKGVAAAFIQFHDKATAPINGDTPEYWAIVSATSNFPLDYGILGRKFRNGIWVCLSSTDTVLTLGGADLKIDAQV